jgi:hypothetical protein
LSDSNLEAIPVKSCVKLLDCSLTTTVNLPYRQSRLSVELAALAGLGRAEQMAGRALRVDLCAVATFGLQPPIFDQCCDESLQGGDAHGEHRRAIPAPSPIPAHSLGP